MTAPKARAASAAGVETTGFLGGRVLLRQPRGGHRAGTDAALVIAAARPYAKGQIADLGAGVGTIGIALAVLEPRLEVALVEIDPELAALAAETAAANDCGERVRVLAQDVRELATRPRALPDSSCDLVVTNPPFTDARSSRGSPDEGRALAHRMKEGDLARWIDAAARLLKPRGSLVLIHRPDGLEAVLAALRPRFGAIVLRPVQPRAKMAATRILVYARKGGRTPLVLAPPLILHEAGGSFTGLAASIHRGEAALGFHEERSRGERRASSVTAT